MLRSSPLLLPPVSLPLRRVGDGASSVSIHPVVTVKNLPQQDLVLPLYLVPLLSLMFTNKPAETALPRSLPSASSQSHLTQIHLQYWGQVKELTSDRLLLPLLVGVGTSCEGVSGVSRMSAKLLRVELGPLSVLSSTSSMAGELVEGRRERVTGYRPHSAPTTYTLSEQKHWALFINIEQTWREVQNILDNYRR